MTCLRTECALCPLQMEAPQVPTVIATCGSIRESVLVARLVRLSMARGRTATRLSEQLHRKVVTAVLRRTGAHRQMQCGKRRPLALTGGEYGSILRALPLAELSIFQERKLFDI